MAESDIKINRAALDFLENTKRELGVTWSECGISRQAVFNWGKKLEKSQYADVQPENLALWIAALEIEVSSIPGLTKNSRRQISKAIQLLKPLNPSIEIHGIDLLPQPASVFGDNDSILELLDDALLSTTARLATLSGFPGTGKSSIVGAWLARLVRRRLLEIDRICVFKFEPQEAVFNPAADEFFDWMLVTLAQSDCLNFNSHAKANRLAKRLAKVPSTILVLDNFETMLVSTSASSGKIQSRSMRDFLQKLVSLGAAENSLCVVTSRLDIECLNSLKETGQVVNQHLENLSDDQGARMLAHLGVDMAESRLREHSRSCHGWPLALVVLSNRLKDPSADSIELMRAPKFPRNSVEGELTDHLDELMAWCEKAFLKPAEKQLLFLVSCFDRAISETELRNFISTNALIEQVTDAIHSLDPRELSHLVDYLATAGLLMVESNPDCSLNASRLLDVHQLLRNWIRYELKTRHPLCWKKLNLHLSHYFAATGIKIPATLSDLMPFYWAASHRCRAQR